MDTQSGNYADAVTLIKQRLNNTFGGYFKHYLEGDPIQIAKADLPMVIVEVVSGSVELGATGYDRFSTQINIRLLMNKEDDFGSHGDTDLTEQKLRKLVEARDKTTGSYHPGTVLGTLRTNYTLGSHLIRADMDWNYDLQPRAGGVVTSEAVVQIVTTENVPVGIRT